MRHSLADINVIFEILHTFESEVMSLRMAFFLGHSNAKFPEDALLNLCCTYGGIFENNDDSYELPSWNNMTLAWMRFLVVNSNDDEAKKLVMKPMEQMQVGKAFFLMLAKLTMQTSEMLESGVDKDQAEARMVEINEEFASVLLKGLE